MSSHRTTWARALTTLKKFVPEAETFSPDEIAVAAEKSNKSVTWRRIPNFDSLDDREIWQWVKPPDEPDPGDEIFLVTDASFSQDIGPFTASYDELDAFIDKFVDDYNDQVFGGDVIIMLPSTLLLVHHEGLLAIVQCKPG